MTYCVGMLVETGLVMIADTRTNAGVDNISTYRKLHVLVENDESIVVAMTAGNLSVSQTALALLREGRRTAERTRGKDCHSHWFHVSSPDLVL